MKTPPTNNVYFGDELVQVVGPDAPLATPKKMWKTGNGCIAHILNEGHFQPMMESPELPKHRENWRTQLTAACLTPPADAELSSSFHTQWHVCHHFLRELVDDDDLLIDLLWVWLPRYQGPNLVLYRGENIDRFDAGRIGPLVVSCGIQHSQWLVVEPGGHVDKARERLVDRKSVV